MALSMAERIDGKQIAAQVLDEVATEVQVLQQQSGVTPGLAVVLVGEDPASQVYVRNKIRSAEAAGIRSIEHRLDSNISQTELNDLIDQLNSDESVNGILVQLPLPAHLNDDAIISAIDPAKDVDGFHTQNVGALSAGQQGMIPCTPLGCMVMLRQQFEDLSGLNAVVVGRSNIVGKPMAALLLQANCTVTIAHSRTRNLADVCRQADILVAAVGRPGFIRADWVKPGATVIDVGINAVGEADGARKLVGDVDPAAADVAGAMTPVPGGVGPMTIACLMKNTLTATAYQLAALNPAPAVEQS